MLACWLICLVGTSAGVNPQEQLVIQALSPEGTFEYDERSGLASDPVGLLLTFRDVKLTAKEIRFYRDSSVIEARGDVRLQKGKNLWVCEWLRYDFATEKLETGPFRFGHEPIFISGDLITTLPTNSQALPALSIAATNVFVTLEDTQRPSYRVRARRLILVPGRYVQVEHATFLIENSPIFYLPRYTYYFDRPSIQLLPVPGYRSSYGPFLLSSVRWEPTPELGVQGHVDYRQKRGAAIGLDLFPELGLNGTGQLKVYYAHDDNPPHLPNGELIDPDRYRVDLKYQANIASNLSFRAAFRKQSDPYMIRDFFDGDYRQDREPKTFVEISRSWPDYSLTFFAMPQVNSFFPTVERMPQLKLTAYDQPIGDSPVYYRSESSAGYLCFRHEQNRQDLDYEAVRADTYQQLSAPIRAFGVVNIIPRAGIRFTHYDIQEGPPTFDKQTTRWVYHTAVEASTKLWKVWPKVQSSWLDFDGLRHIIEPSVTYAYIPRPSPLPNHLPQFDYAAPTFQPLPITLPEYRAIDSIQRQNVIRFGVRNRLQTKRAGSVDDWLDWLVFCDYYPLEDVAGQLWGRVYSAADLKPRSWLVLSSELGYNVETETVELSQVTLTFLPNDRWSFSVGHLYLHGWTDLGPEWDSSLLTSTYYYKLNENWAFRLGQRFDILNGRMEEQEYTLYRDLGAWTAALTFRVREPRRGPTDYTVAFSFSIKAFPRYKVGEDRSKPESLLGD